MAFPFGDLNIVDFGHMLEWVSELSAVAQGEAPSDKAPTLVKGFYGIFGHADERVMIELIAQLTADEQKRIFSFVDWLIAHDGSVLQRLDSHLVRNKFSTFIAKKHNPAKGEKVGTKRVRQKGTWEGVDFDRTTTRDLFSRGGESEAIKLLKRIDGYVKKYGAGPKGHQKTLSELRFMPIRKVGEGGFLTWLDQNFDAVARTKLLALAKKHGAIINRATLIAAADALEASTAASQAKPRNWLVRALGQLPF